jgi:hypothetical protein
MKKWYMAGVALFFLVLACVLYMPIFSSGGLHFSTDDSIGSLIGRKQGLPGAFLGGWSDGDLLGSAAFSTLAWWRVLLWVLPIHIFVNTNHLINLVAASFFLALFLRAQKVSYFSVLVSGISAFWVGTNFTLSYAGHLAKFSILLFAAAYLFCVDRAVRKHSWSWMLLGGASLGMMFAEQADVALFFAILLGPYALFRIWREFPQDRTKSFVRLLPALLGMALLLSIHPLWEGYKVAVKDVSAVQQPDRQQRWDYITQWSLPPEEVTDFFAPGYTGWRSGEPEGPYWGRMGRSAGWEQTGQGFMNFRLENTYIGLIPIAFSLFALFSCRRSARRAEIIFWTAITALALMLSFGKYFPLYSLFWHLPIANNIRNPNKFIQVFQLGLAILTAYGADALFRRKMQGLEGVEQKTYRQFFWIMTAGLGGLVIWALSLSMGRIGDIGLFVSQGWPQQVAPVIVQNKITALWWASLMAAVIAAVFSIFSFPRLEKALRFRNIIAAGLVLLVAADAVLLSKQYVKTIPQGYIEGNAVTRLLRHERESQRVAMITQDGFYNLWLTYLFPYQQIQAFNFTQMPRMADDYKAFLEVVGRNPLRMWQLSGVGFLLGPSGVEKQLPADQYQPVLRYDVLAGNGGAVVVRPNDKGGQAVFRSLAPSPRYALIGGCEKMDDKAALTKLASSDWKLFDKVILPLESSQPDPGGHGFCGQVKVLEYRTGRILLKVQADAPGFLRAADKYDSDWKAQVDGIPAEVLRADFIFQAVFVPAGIHEVELKYYPENKLIWLSFAGLAICASAAVWLVFPKRKKTI